MPSRGVGHGSETDACNDRRTSRERGEDSVEIGMMFWGGRDDLAEIRSLGISGGQLGIGGDIALTREFTAVWKNARRDEKFSVVTVVCAFEGELYTDIPTVQHTV